MKHEKSCEKLKQMTPPKMRWHLGQLGQRTEGSEVLMIHTQETCNLNSDPEKLIKMASLQ